MGEPKLQGDLVVCTRAELSDLVERAVSKALAANSNAAPVKRAFYKPDEAAKLLRKTGRTVRNMCNAGTIKARRVGKDWRIPAAEVDRLLGKE